MSLIDLKKGADAPTRAKTLKEINAPLEGHLEMEHLPLSPRGVQRNGAPLPRMTDPRMVTVVIPDDSRCEDTLRYCAHQMCSGQRVAIVDIPTIIPDALMPQLMDKINEMCRDAAGQVQGHLSSRITVVRTSTGKEHRT